MVEVKLVKIDGEPIQVFNSVIYIYTSNNDVHTLELDIIVSEVIVKKYKNEENLIVEIELEDGRIYSSIMQLKIWSGGLPQLNLYCEVHDLEEYDAFTQVSENDSFFPNIEEGITLEEIRKVEMPNEKITLKLNLPIDQVEWLSKQKNTNVNEMMREMIYEYWIKHSTKAN